MPHVPHEGSHTHHRQTECSPCVSRWRKGRVEKVDGGWRVGDGGWGGWGMRVERWRVDDVDDVDDDDDDDDDGLDLGRDTLRSKNVIV